MKEVKFKDYTYNWGRGRSKKAHIRGRGRACRGRGSLGLEKKEEKCKNKVFSNISIFIVYSILTTRATVANATERLAIENRISCLFENRKRVSNCWMFRFMRGRGINNNEVYVDGTNTNASEPEHFSMGNPTQPWQAFSVVFSSFCEKA